MTSWQEEQAIIASLQPHVVEHENGNHALCDPDECFAAKCRYWRENGGLATSIPEGWKGESWMSKQKKVISEAVANGYDPQPVR
jgi:hypothetical protein